MYHYGNNTITAYDYSISRNGPENPENLIYSLDEITIIAIVGGVPNSAEGIDKKYGRIQATILENHTPKYNLTFKTEVNGRKLNYIFDTKGVTIENNLWLDSKSVTKKTLLLGFIPCKDHDYCAPAEEFN